jgi:hypothetical protein
MPEPANHTQVTKVETTLSAALDILGGASAEKPVVQKPKNHFATPVNKSITTVADIEGDILKKENEEKEKEKIAADAKIKEAAEAKKKEDEEKFNKLSPEEQESFKKKSPVVAILEDEEDTEDEKAKKAGRPVVSKDALIKGLEERFKNKTFFELEGDKPLSEYTEAELWEVIDLNIEEAKKNVADEVPLAFYDSLPEEIQTAYAYLENTRAVKGGYDKKDVQHILKVVTQVIETQNLDVETESGQEQIIRTYLAMRDNATPEELDEEINALKDKGELEKKAGQFKPKLDSLHQQRMEQLVKTSEANRKKAEKQAEAYSQRVISTLKTGEVKGIKIDKKTQANLYEMMVQPQYLSFQGDNAELEKLMLSALVFQDPDGFLEKVRLQGSNAQATAVAKKLKTEQANKGAALHNEEADNAHRGVKKLQRKENKFTW